MDRERRHAVAAPFDLAATCGPVTWGGDRWPDVAWSGGRLTWIGREDGVVVHRRVRQLDDGLLALTGSAPPARDRDWLAAVLGVGDAMPRFTDPVLAGLAGRWPGLRPFASGSLYAGLLTSIVGQSVSVAAAAVTLTRVADLFHPGEVIAGRRLVPLPTATQLASAEPAALRATGVTWRRAHALVALGQAVEGDAVPSLPAGAGPPEIEAARARLRGLPLVGPWTAESALLWGVGASDVHPTGDAALLRAARRAYDRSDLDHGSLDALATGWRPYGGWAARLLWLALLGAAPGPDRSGDAQPSAAAAASA